MCRLLTISSCLRQIIALYPFMVPTSLLNTAENRLPMLNEYFLRVDAVLPSLTEYSVTVEVSDILPQSQQW